MGVARAIAETFPRERYKTVIEISGAEGRRWMEEADFKDTHVQQLAGPDSVMVQATPSPLDVKMQIEKAGIEIEPARAVIEGAAVTGETLMLPAGGQLQI